MDDKMTLKEISELAQVSISTVSRVLSNATSVKQETRDKVLAVINSSSYSTLRKKTNHIGVVVPDILNPFFPLLLRGIESISKIQGYRLIVCNSENNSRIEDKIIEDLLDINIDGIVFIGANDTAPPSLKRVVDEKILPVVLLDRDIGLNGDTSLITADNIQGMLQSALYLLGLGHRRILYMGGPPQLSTEKQRLKGFQEALKREHVDKNLIRYLYADYTMEGGYALMESILSEGKPQFTAICASNDLMAHGAYKSMITKGYRIPQDISIIGYDDIPSSEIIGLTSIRQPFEEMGRTSMMALIDMILNGHPLRSRSTLVASLIIRNSCIAVTN